MKWLKSFKIALIEEDIKAVDTLLTEIPEFKKIEDMRSAYTLIGEAKKKFEDEQLIIQQKMNKMQQAKKFLTANVRESSFDEVY
jgi:uncharacterized protein YukE